LLEHRLSRVEIAYQRRARLVLRVRRQRVPRKNLQRFLQTADNNWVRVTMLEEDNVIDRKRCPWGETPDIYVDYHDTEWGAPVTDDHGLFEFLVLETFQAGLSWLIVLSTLPPVPPLPLPLPTLECYHPPVLRRAIQEMASTASSW
jgi:hypothetical protein